MDVHELTLGPVDDLPGLELVLELVGLIVQRLQVAEASECQLDGRDELGLLERLDQVGRGRRRRGPAR